MPGEVISQVLLISKCNICNTMPDKEETKWKKTKKTLHFDNKFCIYIKTVQTKHQRPPESAADNPEKQGAHSAAIMLYLWQQYSLLLFSCHPPTEHLQLVDLEPKIKSKKKIADILCRRFCYSGLENDFSTSTSGVLIHSLPGFLQMRDIEVLTPALPAAVYTGSPWPLAGILQRDWKVSFQVKYECICLNTASNTDLFAGWHYNSALC